MSSVLMILGMVAVTWGVRAAPFIVPRLELSPPVLRFLNCIPAAVLAALIAEPVISPAVEVSSVFVPEVLAASICLVLGVFRAPMLATVIVGMASFWVLSIYM